MSCAHCPSGCLREVQGTLVCESCAIVDAVGCVHDSMPTSAGRGTAHHAKMPAALNRLIIWENEQRPCLGSIELRQVADTKLRLSPATVDFAVDIYNDFKTRRSNSLRGDFKRGVMANSIMMAGRAMGGDKRCQREVLAAFNITSQTLGNSRKLMKAELVGRSYFGEAFAPMTIEDVVHEFLTCKGVVERHKRQAVIKAVAEVENRLREEGMIDGKAPASVAAGILKHILKGTASTTEIARLCCTSTHTTNAVFKMVEKLMS